MDLDLDLIFNKTIIVSKEHAVDNSNLNFEDGGLANLPKCSLFEDTTGHTSDETYKDFYARDAKKMGMKIEDYMIKQVQICEQYIKRDLPILQKYIDDIVKKEDWLKGLDKKELDFYIKSFREFYKKNLLFRFN